MKRMNGKEAIRYKGRLEYAHTRRLRVRNKQHYRLAHWPLWIAVFFLAPGSSVFALFDHGWDKLNVAWLLVVLAGTGIAGFRGLLPGPYILRFDEDRRNPVYRRVCYTFAWNAILSFSLLNLCGIAVATFTGNGYLQQIYRFGYPPLCGLILVAGMAGRLPRAGASTRGEGMERRYFYACVWAVTLAQVFLLAVWRLNLPTEMANPMKLLAFLSALILTALASFHGILPRTRPIVPGELIVAD